MRSYANIVTSIWAPGSDFCERSAGAQRTYFMLVSQPEITACGVLAYTLRRWQNTLPKNERTKLDKWLDELIEHAYIVVDRETDELLIRSFVRWDQGYGNRKRLPVIKAAMTAIRSLKLAEVMAKEADRLQINVEGVFTQMNTPSDGLWDALSGGPSDGISPSDRVVVTKVGSSPQPSNHNPQPGDQSASGRPATRIPDGFAITEPMRSWAQGKVVGLNLELATEKFINHFTAQSGSRGVMLDWIAAWKKWMIGDFERMPAHSSTGLSRHEENAETVRRMQEREQAARNGNGTHQPHLAIEATR